MSTVAFQQFSEVVLNNPDLQTELAGISDVETFAAKVMERAAERRLNIDAADITEAMNAGRRALIEQWI